jgi:cytochrome c-type biogenesis protein CcmH/NrfF
MERELANEIICTCGCRLPAGECGMMNCHGKAEQLGKLKDLVDQGLDRDAILATFVRDYGGADILTRPPDTGFNRLAWLFPYLAGGIGAIGIAVFARRWSRGGDHAAPNAAEQDADLQARLDDELRDLD